MSYAVEYSENARRDIARLVGFLAEKDLTTARRAHSAITKSIQVLENFPFSTRVADGGDPLIRELLITFGSAGYVALYAIGEELVTIVAIRHQLEEDYL